jgi:branched-chain amino acid transport system ATP-binding protein
VETYYGPVMALRGVSLDVEEGTIVTLLGANGAGKTTILKTISGAVDPQKGSIAFAGPGSRGWTRTASCAGHRPCARGARGVSRSHGVRENLMMGAFTRKTTATASPATSRWSTAISRA